MTRTRLIVLAVLAPFGVLSLVALAEHGYVALFTQQMQNSAGLQVLVDLCIALTLVLIGLWRDAKTLGRPFWPWVVMTLALGSFGPLLYLLTRRENQTG